MKTKLEMAHDIAVAMQSKEPITDMKLLASLAWQYADAMQAEADKREKEEQSEYVFEAIDGWQPDWSQAPEWANWWVATANQSGKITGGWFYEDEPEFGLRDNPSAYISVGCKVILTDSFGYIGDWRNSLRKRPN